MTLDQDRKVTECRSDGASLTPLPTSVIIGVVMMKKIYGVIFVWATKVGVAMTGALPKSWRAQKGGGARDPCQDFSGGCDKLYKGQPKVIMDP